MLLVDMIWYHRSFCFLTLNEHEQPHAEGDGCSTYGRNMVLHSVVLIIVGHSLLLQRWARRV
jgi:hypothetical protein